VSSEQTLTPPPDPELTDVAAVVPTAAFVAVATPAAGTETLDPADSVPAAVSFDPLEHPANRSNDAIRPLTTNTVERRTIPPGG
jgi:hypothetical protein